MTEINIFDITPIGTKKWKRALLQYEHILEPINEKIALVLKSKIHQNMNDTRKVNFQFLHIEYVYSIENMCILIHIQWNIHIYTAYSVYYYYYYQPFIPLFSICFIA